MENDNNLIEDFLKEHSVENKIENDEFEKYSELFKNKFGRYPKIAEPGGTKERTIEAIKICLEENEDILDELIFENDILGLRSFYVKRINDFENLEKNLIKAVIYYIIATRSDEEYNLDAVFRVLSYERKFFTHYINELPSEHLAKNYFSKVEYLSDKEYVTIANAIKEKIAEIMSVFYDKEKYSFKDIFNSEQDVEKYISELLKDKIKNLYL